MLFVTIVLDGVGIGEQPDASVYGDVGSDTLGHVLAHRPVILPNLQRLGLGCIRPLDGMSCPANPIASYGRMQETSAGKDSTTGHWELAGLSLPDPFPVYPDGFPRDVLETFCDLAGVRGVLGNRPESGTVIIEEFGPEHLISGDPIVYTSADSVFQVAAHVDVIPLDDLYRMCKAARDEVCIGEHGVGRVIARPFTGVPGAFSRLSNQRRDFSRLPESKPLQQVLQEAGVTTVCVGKVADLFGGVGFDHVSKTGSNREGIEATLHQIRTASGPTFVWVNLIDFDQEFGHRNNPDGFAGALEEFDAAVPDLLAALPDGAHLAITADHGNDPTTASTDHSREYVPLLYYGLSEPMNLGTRATFADHAASVASYFGVPFACDGTPIESI